MALNLPFPRLHLFEIDDQPWFPSRFRSYVQSVLTHFWTFQIPPFQSTSPASLVAQTLQNVLKSRLPNYSYVDFCSGAGGPTPYIEREVNRQANRVAQSTNDHEDSSILKKQQHPEVDFVLTDLHPHLKAWRSVSRASERGRLTYVPVSVDASRASKEVLQLAEPHRPPSSFQDKPDDGKKVFRLFSLAFHHFNDELAIKILQNTLETSDGFAIFELQGRDVGNLLTVLLMWPTMLLGSWYWLWGEWDQLFWTYVIPVVPFVIVYDGLVSCLRTRREEEVFALLKKAAERVQGGLEGWTFQSGEEVHTWPTGSMSYFIGVKT